MRPKADLSKKILQIIAVLIIIIPFLAANKLIFARDWDDLYEKTTENLRGSEKEKRLKADLFFFERENWEGHSSTMLFWLFKSTDYPKYESLRVLPFYYGLSSKVDNRSLWSVPVLLSYGETDGSSKMNYTIPLFYNETYKTESKYKRMNLSLLHFYWNEEYSSSKKSEYYLGIPIIPFITFNAVDEYGGHRNFFCLIDYSWDTYKGNDTIDRFWVIPLFFYKHGDSGYTAINPLFFDNRHNNGERYMHFLPLFKWEKSINTHYSAKKEQYEYETSFYSLVYSNDTTRKGSWDGAITKETTWFGPILPVYYSYIETGGESHRNIMWLFDWHNTKEGNTDRFWAAPLYFAKDNSYRHILPPIYMSFEDKTNSYWHLLPVYMSSKSFETTNSGVAEYSSFSISPLHVSNSVTKGSYDGEVIESSNWFPILPLIYYSSLERSGEMHRNILWLFDWHNTKDGNTDRFWAAPLYFAKDNSYRHILPPIYMSSFDDKYAYRHALPFFISYDYKDSELIKDKKIDTYNSRFFTLLWGSTSTEDASTHETLSSNFWFPILPVLYYDSADQSGTHKNVLGIFDWARDNYGGLERIWIVPFVFHEEGAGRYRVYTPFYIRPSGWTEERGYSFGLLHYNSWSPECDTTLFPLHYTRDNRETKWFVNVWAPLYYNVKSPERDTTLFLPLYFSTESTTNPDSKFYINILGITRSIASGPNPNVSIGGGKSEYGYYVDTDISWLYSAFSFTTRTTIIKTASKDEQLTGEITLTDKSAFNRDNSVDFWGVKLLFGLFDYESADSKRHFRILPLCWLTWDTTSNDDIYWIINTVYYKTRDSSYFVFFPLYGEQHIGESYRYGYLLNGFWIEYDAEQKQKEYTLLWPLVNYYSSPTQNGGRIAPIFWYRHWTEDGKTATRSFIPLLYYYKNVDDEKTGEDLYSLSFSPVYFYNFEKENTGSTKKLYSLLPLPFFRTVETTFSGTTETGINSSLVVFPILASSYLSTAEPGAQKTETSSTFILPLLYYSTSTVKTTADGKQDESGTKFAFGYYSDYTPEYSYWTFMGLVGGKSYTGEKNYSSTLLFGLHKREVKDDTYSNYTFPFYAYNTSGKESDFKLLLGLYGKTSSSHEKYSFNSWSALYWLIYSSTETKTLNYNNVKEETTTTKTWFPLVYTSSENIKSSERTRFSRFILTPFFMRYNTEYSKGEDDTLFWAPVLPLVYRHSNEHFSHTNVALIFDYEKDKSKDTTRFWAAPLIFSKTGSDGYLNIMGPLYISWWNDEQKENSKFIAGLYLTESPHYEQQNLLYIFNHIKNVRDKIEKTGLIFGIFSKETSEREIEYAFLWGAGFDYKESRTGDDYERYALGYLIAQKKLKDYYQNRCLPLWYYSSDKNESTLVIPPALTYINRGTNGDEFHMVGLGALWYRNNNTGEKSDRQMALLGIPYYSVTKPEKGYSSTGILWGILYDHETESETGFEKQSVLKGVIYKSVTMEGKTRNSILGITID